MKNEELIPHLFRTEYRKIVAVLTKHFGFEQIEIAEDIASDTFLTAAEKWEQKGIPPNPAAWLYYVAKNKARNYLRRNILFTDKIAPILPYPVSDSSEADIDLSPENINDSQLQMMFAICHPSIPVTAQIGLSLRILCGFGIEEIADAFLTNKETINKRLSRAKEKLRAERINMEMPALPEMGQRLEAVLTTIYLLFSEGYYSSSANKTLRKDLCLEAMRLCYMLVENAATTAFLLRMRCSHSCAFMLPVLKHGLAKAGSWCCMRTRTFLFGMRIGCAKEPIFSIALPPEITFPNTTWRRRLPTGIRVKRIHRKNGSISCNATTSCCR